MSDQRELSKSYDFLIRNQGRTLDMRAAYEAAKATARMAKPLRSERTIRNQAKDVADIVWERPYDLFEKGLQMIEEQVLFDKISRYLEPQDWPEGWRRTYRMVWPNQSRHRQQCWPRFYKLARQMLITMLGRDDIPDLMKARIYDAIIEDKERCS